MPCLSRRRWEPDGPRNASADPGLNERSTPTVRRYMIPVFSERQLATFTRTRIEAGIVHEAETWAVSLTTGTDQGARECCHCPRTGGTHADGRTLGTRPR